MRLNATQIWPTPPIAAGTSVGSTSSRSASSRMIAGDLPPSSSTVRARRGAVCVTTSTPTLTPPVMCTMSTPGWLTRCRLASKPTAMMFTTPSGKPAASAHSAITRAVSCESGAALAMKTHPAKSPGMIFIPISGTGPL